MTNSVWGNMLNEKFARPKEGYAAHHLEHVGSNPMYAQRMAQAYHPKAAKIEMKQPQASSASPWIYMKGK